MTETTIETPQAKGRPWKRITKKEKTFIDEYIKTGNGTQSALKAYDTTDYKTASAIAAENLNKPRIQRAMKELGFSEEGAKAVVQEIMYSKKTDAHARLRATDQVFKVAGSYAPEKHLHATFSLVELGNTAQQLANPVTPQVESTPKKTLEAPTTD